MDNVGNIIDMPPLRGKPCFGRPETFFRHGYATKKVPNVYGSMVDSSNHQCGRCPVRIACGFVCTVRVFQNSEMKDALSAWVKDCDSRQNGTRIYTGASGRFWTEFLKAIVRRGPFSNSNDRWLKGQDELLRTQQREKAVVAKRRQRERDRRNRTREMLLPTLQAIQNLLDHRDELAKLLQAAIGEKGLHRSISRITLSSARQSASLTANVWLSRELIMMAGIEARPGTIAGFMVDCGLAQEKTYAILKGSMSRYLARIFELEGKGKGRIIWPRFVPDADLYQRYDDCCPEDDDKVVGTSVDLLVLEILRDALLKLRVRKIPYT